MYGERRYKAVAQVHFGNMHSGNRSFSIAQGDKLTEKIVMSRNEASDIRYEYCLQAKVLIDPWETIQLIEKYSWLF